MNPNDRIFVAGHRGLVGSALVRRLESEGYRNLLLRTRTELDLTDGAAVERFFREARPQHVVLAAAHVGGIAANAASPTRFLAVNLHIELNVIQAAHRAGVERLLFLGSSCIYPRLAPQPISETALLTGPLEPTNEAYAIAKIAGIKLCEAYRREAGADFFSVMPTNLYGPGDNFDPDAGHVVPALMHRMYEARRQGHDEVVVWGTGTPLRELLFVDDLAKACLLLMREGTEHDLVNVGSGEEVTIRQLAEAIARVTGFEGRLRFDTTRPDGTPRKLLNSSRIRALGWTPTTALKEGLERTFEWYRNRPGSPGRTS